MSKNQDLPIVTSPYTFHDNIIKKCRNKLFRLLEVTPNVCIYYQYSSKKVRNKGYLSQFSPCSKANAQIGIFFNIYIFFI